MIIVKAFCTGTVPEYFKELSFLTCEEGFHISSFYPKNEFIKPNSDLNFNTKVDSLHFVNIIQHSDQNLNEAFSILNQNFVIVNYDQFSCAEEFANFVFENSIPGFIAPKNFWIPFETTLTRRQLEILYYVYKGLGSKKIAETLNLSPRTVELHRQNAINKIGSLSPSKLEELFSNYPALAVDLALRRFKQ